MEENKLPELDQTILPWLGRTMKALDYYLNDHLASRGLKLTKAQMILLKVLFQQGAMAQNNLAFITNRDKTSLTRLINTMEKKNFVIRSVDKNDKRIKLVSITEEGKKMFNSAIPILQEIISTIQEGIEQKDLEMTIKVLKQIGKNIKIDELTTPLNK
ncbi:DNA-binding transcriptional regulator, MarR family [Reichenbachiella faecimaris]|uniref:DNA-binding transcriptional regulator, MarR family n=1 Tax=Reichenbachiella faecimaris TaxID=692418 RepID=A0A1W2G885_REIFA|nr:MarR family transcriptional regulator [Reichenbachiella faecimaris]SMD32642.1 DNA-binding transcriptional regulator, MarR family [Reichenbachiella faecimaris]